MVRFFEYKNKFKYNINDINFLFFLFSNNYFLSSHNFYLSLFFSQKMKFTYNNTKEEHD